MNPSCKGRIALVTGATRNLGYTIAATLADAGAIVVAHGPSAEEAAAAVDRLKKENPRRQIEPIAFNLADPTLVDAAFAELRARQLEPDILVNNAADLGLDESSFLEQSPDLFRRVIEINLLAVFRCSQLAARHMAARGLGTIVNITSLAGERPILGRSAYSTSKAAVEGLTRAMALELAGKNITVNAISPGYVWTDRWKTLAEDKVKRRKRNVPRGEPTRPEEIARLVLFFASGAVPTMTGCRVACDGGLGIQQVPGDVAV